MYYLKEWLRMLLTPVRYMLSPAKLLTVPRKLLGLSLPARAAWLVAIMLIICAVAALIVEVKHELAADPSALLPWLRIAAIVVLIFVIPIVVYYTLKLWFEGETSRFPDIDRAWREGMEAIEEAGIDLQKVPVFLLLGVPDGPWSDALITAAQIPLAGEADRRMGNPPLRFYLSDEAGKEAVYIASVGASALSLMNRTGGSQEAGGHGGGGPTETLAPDDAHGTLTGDHPHEAGGGSDGGRDDGYKGDAGYEMNARYGAVNYGEPDYGGSLLPQETFNSLLPDDHWQPAPTGRSRKSVHAEDLGLQEERLDYVCRLLSRVRQPICPINGVLTMFPYAVVRFAHAPQDIANAVKTDLEVCQYRFQLFFPVMAVVGGMEAESGFFELVRRIGVKAKSGRFGKGFTLANSPTAERLDSFTAHSCGAFEVWAYNLFKGEGFHKSGNPKLYALLCQVRSRLHPQLKKILEFGFGAEDHDDQPPFFGGCYFAATSPNSEGQAFVKGIFDKLLMEEEELDWMDEALYRDSRCQSWAQFVLFVDALLATGLAVFFVLWMMGRLE